MLMKLLLLVFILSIAGNNLSAQSTNDLDILIQWLSGSFSSEEQSKNDSDFFNISLEMYRIWSEREDGYWMYIEQASALTKDKPYRQRIYNFIQEGDSIINFIYSIPDEKNYVGAWKNPDILSSLKPSDLELKDGCEVVIKKLNEDTFTGSTIDNNCPSNLRGAYYATAKVLITKDAMISWDQGFNENNEQVWGAVKSGYVFKKIIDRIR